MRIVRRVKFWRVDGHWRQTPNGARWVNAYFQKKIIEIPIPDNWITEKPNE